MYVFYLHCLRYKIRSLDACPVLYGWLSVLPAFGLGEATTWSGLHMLYLNVLCYMGAAEMAFCAACIWPGRGQDMVRSTFAVFKLCVKMYVFFDIFTVCVIGLGHWMPVLCYMGAAEMAFLCCLHVAWERPRHGQVYIMLYLNCV